MLYLYPLAGLFIYAVYARVVKQYDVVSMCLMIVLWPLFLVSLAVLGMICALTRLLSPCRKGLKMDANLLFELYQKWCEKNNEPKVTLTIETDESGSLEGWNDEYRYILEWSTIEDGCRKLQEMLS